MHAMAERLVTDGYFVALPNVFYRAGAFAPFDLATVWSDPPERARIMALIEQASPRRSCRLGGNRRRNLVWLAPQTEERVCVPPTLALPSRSAVLEYASVDLVGAACCGMGAIMVMSGNTSSSLSAYALTVGLYGVHRTTRTGLTKALIASPAAVWALGNVWHFVPDRLAQGVLSKQPILAQASANLAATVFLVALLLMVIAARPRLGAGLSTATFVALAIGLFFRLVPSTRLQNEPGSIALLALRTEAGWSVVAAQLSGLCLFLTGVGPLAVQPLPRRGGAIAGAAGAVLLGAGIAGLEQRIPSTNAGALFGFGLLWLVGNILSAIGLGAMARAGAKPAGWIGVGLVVLGIFGMIPALVLFERTEANAYGFVMSTPFALLGIGIALLGWKGAPLELARKVLGGLFIAAFAGGTLAWLATYITFARIVNAREPWSFARLTTEPMATHGLVLWAALLLYLAAPPRAGANHGLSMVTPTPQGAP